MYGATIDGGRTTSRSGFPGGTRAVRRPAPSGHRTRHDDQDWVVHTRRVARPVPDVWAALAEEQERARWVGRSRALDASTGEFLFTFEGDDLLPMSYRVDHVEEGRGAGISLRDPGAERSWRLEVDLLDEGRHTVLRVEQTIVNVALAPSVAAGCEFYLDRLVAHLEGRDGDALDYDDYFLASAEHYRRLFPCQQRRRVTG